MCIDAWATVEASMWPMSSPDLLGWRLERIFAICSGLSLLRAPPPISDEMEARSLSISGIESSSSDWDTCCSSSSMFPDVNMLSLRSKSLLFFFSIDIWSTAFWRSSEMFAAIFR